MAEQTAPTPTCDDHPQRPADFATLTQALDYAAAGRRGFNFHDARGRLREVLPYRELRERARNMARRLIALGLRAGDRVAMVVDTEAAFPVVFFGCRYAGLVPVALPLPVNLGSHEAYVEQIRGLLQACDANLVVAGDDYNGLVQEAMPAVPGVTLYTPGALEELPAPEAELPPSVPGDVAYLQFTSGSTRFSRGVVITERAVMSNLQGIVRHGLQVRPDDRCASWLPLYHDMGLVGFLLGPMVSQLSVDYLRPRDFGVRPLRWLGLISSNRCTIAFGPPFGYALCSRRLRPGDLEGLDLRSWRIAGVGAEMIRPAVLDSFAELLAPAGFDTRAFVACYGLAEASLAVTFAPLSRGLDVMSLDRDALARDGKALPAAGSGAQEARMVSCGPVLPGHQLVIRDEHHQPLPDGQIGRVTVSGPSLMSGYFRNPEASREVLHADGWMDTGDLGFMTDGQLVVTGRRKDLIIVNGRNIWPQDLEHLAEGEPEVRAGDASAFAVPGRDGTDQVVLVVQCRLHDAAQRGELAARLRRGVYAHAGVRCTVELVPPHTLPRTSSGKLSRAAARRDYLQRLEQDDTAASAAAAAHLAAGVA